MINYRHAIRAFGFAALAVTAIFLAAGPARAKEGDPKVDAFVGFSSERQPVSNGTDYYGVQGNVNYNFNKFIGFNGDLGYQRKTVAGFTVAPIEYMIGPRANFRTKRVTLFLQGLAGGLTLRGSYSGSSATVNGFAMGVGGGVDINLNSRLALRVIQLDSIHDHVGGNWNHSLRSGFGIVFRL